MDFIIVLSLFILGTIFGSFYNVVGYRVPKKQSILYPASHCTKCNHTLAPIELIPVISFFIQGGKCKCCKEKISWFYPIFELLSGILFSLSYIVFGLSLECLFSIVFISMLLIVIISDYQTMTIPDSILIIFFIMLVILRFIISGYKEVFFGIISMILSFCFMFLLKKLGDFLFKKESMGGGDIKLLAVIGFSIGFFESIMVVFLSSFIALPLLIIVVKKNLSHEIPYGPFLAISAMIIILCQFDFTKLINLLSFY